MRVEASFKILMNLKFHVFQQVFKNLLNVPQTCRALMRLRWSIALCIYMCVWLNSHRGRMLRNRQFRTIQTFFFFTFYFENNRERKHEMRSHETEQLIWKIDPRHGFFIRRINWRIFPNHVMIMFELITFAREYNLPPPPYSELH